MPRHYENLTRHNIQLNTGDLAWLQDTYPNISAASIIRTLIQRHRREVETAVDRKVPISTLRRSTSP
jgi:hypothetical protein